MIERVFGKQRPSASDLKLLESLSDEDNLIEFKENIGKVHRDLLRPIVAFANSRGGLLLLGVTDEGHRAVGTDLKVNDLDNYLKRYIEPSLSGLYSIFEIKLNSGKYIHLIEVGFSPDIHAVRGSPELEEKAENKQPETYTYYVRAGQSSRKMSPPELNRISIIKKDYRFNFEFRLNLLERLNGFISGLLRWFNIHRTKKIDEHQLMKYATSYYQHREVEGELSQSFPRLIEETRLEFLYNEIQSKVVDLFRDILIGREIVPHDRLTFDEESTLISIENIMSYGLGFIDEKVTLERLETKSSPFIVDSDIDPLSLQGFSVKSLIGFMFKYLYDLQDDEEAYTNELSSFEWFLQRHKGFTWIVGREDKPPLTISDMKTLFKEYFEQNENKYPDVNELYQKIDLRMSQFLDRFCQSFSHLISDCLILRDLVYENLSLPIPRDADSTLLQKYKNTHPYS